MRKKVSTILPRTPSPPLSRHPSSLPITHTSIPPSQDTSQHPPPQPPFPLPISHPTISPLLFLPSSTTPFHHTRYHPNHLGVATLSLIPSPTPLLPAQSEPFTLDRYSGETDLGEHLKIYITYVALYTSHDVVFYTSHDVVFYKAFPTIFKGPALKWFTTLPPYSIDCFDTLSHMFTTHFTGNRPHQTTTISLLGVRQEQDETLRAFIDRFSKATLCTPHLNQEMILQCMALTLKLGPFANNVYLHPPTSMHELKLCVADYICME